MGQHECPGGQGGETGRNKRFPGKQRPKRVLRQVWGVRAQGHPAAVLPIPGLSTHQTSCLGRNAALLIPAPAFKDALSDTCSLRSVPPTGKRTPNLPSKVAGARAQRRSLAEVQPGECQGRSQQREKSGREHKRGCWETLGDTLSSSGEQMGRSREHGIVVCLWLFCFEGALCRQADELVRWSNTACGSRVWQSFTWRANATQDLTQVISKCPPG